MTGDYEAFSPSRDDLADQGGPVAGHPTVSVGVLRGDNSDYVLLTFEPKGEPVRRMRLSIGGADVLLAELGGLLYGEPAPDLAGQGEPVAWAEVRAACSAVVAASEAANGVDPTDEQLDRLWDAIDGIRGIASADSRPLYAAPAPSRPADREEIAQLLYAVSNLIIAPRMWPEWEPLPLAEDPAASEAHYAYADAIIEHLALRDAPRTGGDGIRDQSAVLYRLRAAFNSDRVADKNIALRRAYDVIADLTGSSEKMWREEAPPSPNAGDGTQDTQGGGR